jgi:tRNA(fMet)-specific endonuclease VapC
MIPMPFVLDTNHFTEFVDASVLGERLLARIEERNAEVFTCIVAVEETMQGWLALLRRSRTGRDQLAPYAKFQLGLETLLQLAILPFDADAAAIFHRLHSEFPRKGTMDLKIASICIAHEAMLLTRNLVDFRGLPNLLVENWLD